MSPSRRLLASSAVVALVVGLSACAPAVESEEPVVEPSTSATPEPVETPTASPEPEAQPRVFTMPADCTVMLPPERVTELTEQNLALLGGPGSLYGDEYFFNATPEQLAGGISCVWAQEGVDLSSLLISAAPLTTATRGQIITDLSAQGLNEVILEDGSLTYGVVGDEAAAGAQFNLLTDDAWISVINAFGGDVFFDEAVVLANEVLDHNSE
ncbi:hypothetical protein OVN18_10150 [Microcella daejeonensis]|jgi:hypothetical protein|uniref:Uncharacterized protein n=1 Tax=Microcella daejeonensis TaxID=2994971 RepID=A0A9E8MJX0_9MICO|nr:hypothetical protein [Microcella daejeonensis]WAB80919.1 hypothetical protein OVN18_10150 [Microcella daejeonensis]